MHEKTLSSQHQEAWSMLECVALFHQLSFNEGSGLFQVKYDNLLLNDFTFEF